MRFPTEETLPNLDTFVRVSDLTDLQKKLVIALEFAFPQISYYGKTAIVKFIQDMIDDTVQKALENKDD